MERAKLSTAPQGRGIASCSGAIFFPKRPALPLINLAISSCPPTQCGLARGLGGGSSVIEADHSLTGTPWAPALGQDCAWHCRGPIANQRSPLVPWSQGDSPRDEPSQHRDLLEESMGAVGMR